MTEPCRESDEPKGNAVSESWMACCTGRSRFRDGRFYQHTCTLESFADVARFVEEHGRKGVTTGMLWDRLDDMPCTQATVALEFLKDRGCVEVDRRRCWLASGVIFEDARCEWHALAFQGEIDA